MRRGDVQVPVTISIPKSMDDFLARMCRKVIQVGDEKMVIERKKTQLIARGLEYAMEHCEEWIK